jgi:hypothetical protein
VVLRTGEDGGPRVEAVVYPHPDYEAGLWSQWGQGLVLPDGRFLSAIGDHRGADGNAYLYEYSPDGTLRMIGDVLSHTDHEPGTWGYGKVHGQMVPGPCGEVYFATYWGDRDGLVYGPAYRGDLLFRLDPDRRTIANLGVLVPERGTPSLTGWTEGGLLYGEAVEPLSDKGTFFVYDVARDEVVFRHEDPGHIGFRNVAVDVGGRAYYSVGQGALAVYDPEANRIRRHPYVMPGEWMRASSHPGPDGTVFGVTVEPDALFALEPSGEIRTLGPVRGYTTSVALHPDGSRLFYVPEAHGDSWTQGTPLISVDTRTGAETVLVELNALGEEHLGMRLGGTYNIAVDPSGRAVYVGMNAGDPAADESFGEVVLLVVRLP